MDVDIHLDIDAKMAEVIDPDTLSDISKSLDGEDAGICVARFGAKSKVKAGQSVAVGVDCERLHFFDVLSGLAIH